MDTIKIRKVQYKGWDNCIEMSNGSIELIVTTDVGPRIIHFGFAGMENELFQFDEEIGKSGGDKYCFYGGHRLWAAPQDAARTAELDNIPVPYTIEGNTLILNPEPNPLTRLEKTIVISMGPGDRVDIDHRITNRNVWDIELALWSLTFMAEGASSIVPVSQSNTLLAPNRILALWPWSKMGDPKMSWGNRYIIGKQYNISGKPRLLTAEDPEDPCGPYTNAVKFGLNNDHGWAAVANHGNLFLLRFDYIENERYTDQGSSYESFICDYFTEIETLSPLYRIKPGEYKDHRESWELYRDIACPDSEEDIINIIEPLVQSKGEEK